MSKSFFEIVAHKKGEEIQTVVEIATDKDQAINICKMLSSAATDWEFKQVPYVCFGDETLTEERNNMIGEVDPYSKIQTHIWY